MQEPETSRESQKLLREFLRVREHQSTSIQRFDSCTALQKTTLKNKDTKLQLFKINSELMQALLKKPKIAPREKNRSLLKEANFRVEKCLRMPENFRNYWYGLCSYTPRMQPETGNRNRGMWC